MSMFLHRQSIIEKVREKLEYMESILDDIGTDKIEVLLFKLQDIDIGVMS